MSSELHFHYYSTILRTSGVCSEKPPGKLNAGLSGGAHVASADLMLMHQEIKSKQPCQISDWPMLPRSTCRTATFYHFEKKIKVFKGHFIQWQSNIKKKKAKNNPVLINVDLMNECCVLTSLS